MAAAAQRWNPIPEDDSVIEAALRDAYVPIMRNSKGRVTQNWPFTLLEYWTRTRTPDPADFVLT